MGSVGGNRRGVNLEGEGRALGGIRVNHLSFL